MTTNFAWLHSKINSAQFEQHPSAAASAPLLAAAVVESMSCIRKQQRFLKRESTIATAANSVNMRLSLMDTQSAVSSVKRLAFSIMQSESCVDNKRNKTRVKPAAESVETLESPFGGCWHSYDWSNYLFIRSFTQLHPPGCVTNYNSRLSWTCNCHHPLSLVLHHCQLPSGVCRVRAISRGPYGPSLSKEALKAWRRNATTMAAHWGLFCFILELVCWADMNCNAGAIYTLKHYYVWIPE